MRTVIYTHDMEPITVVELRSWQIEYLERHGVVTLAVMPDPARWMSTDELLTATPMPYVHVAAKWFRHNGERHMLLFTRQEETAMALESEFLPGQRRKLREHEREAFGRGLAAAFGVWGG